MIVFKLVVDFLLFFIIYQENLLLIHLDLMASRMKLVFIVIVLEIIPLKMECRCIIFDGVLA